MVKNKSNKKKTKKKSKIPDKYTDKLSRRDKKKQQKNLIKSRKMYKKGIYVDRPKLKSSRNVANGSLNSRKDIIVKLQIKVFP